jgi:hypothetical protein
MRPPPHKKYVDQLRTLIRNYENEVEHLGQSRADELQFVEAFDTLGPAIIISHPDEQYVAKVLDILRNKMGILTEEYTHPMAKQPAAAGGFLSDHFKGITHDKRAVIGISVLENMQPALVPLLKSNRQLSEHTAAISAIATIPPIPSFKREQGVWISPMRSRGLAVRINFNNVGDIVHAMMSDEPYLTPDMMTPGGHLAHDEHSRDLARIDKSVRGAMPDQGDGLELVHIPSRNMSSAEIFRAGLERTLSRKIDYETAGVLNAAPSELAIPVDEFRKHSVDIAKLAHKAAHQGQAGTMFGRADRN